MDGAREIGATHRALSGRSRQAVAASGFCVALDALDEPEHDGNVSRAVYHQPRAAFRRGTVSDSPARAALGSTFTQAMADETMTSATMKGGVRPVDATEQTIERDCKHEEEDGAGEVSHHADAKELLVGEEVGGGRGVWVSCRKDAQVIGTVQRPSGAR